MDTSGSASLDNAIDILCKGSPNLKKLCLPDPSGLITDAPITDAAVLSIATHCPHIETLSLRSWAGITDISMTYLAQLLRLREIDLSQCYQLTSDGVQGLLKANRKLEVLILSEKGLYEDNQNNENDNDILIDDALMRCIGRHCPNLVKLHLRLDSDLDYSDLSASAFEAMIKGLPSLKDLVVTNYYMPNSILQLLGTYCPGLRDLHIDGISCSDEEGFISMCQGCPLIESLTLRNLSSISDMSMLAIARHYTMLKELSLSYLDDITDDSLCVLFTSCTHLTSLALTDMWITDRAILTLLRHCPHLRSLKLCDTPGLTDYCIQAIPTYCPQLQSLELECMSTLTRETIIQISRYCKQLHTLITYNCNKINNNTVVAVLKHAKQLSKLNIYSHNVSVNDEFKAQCDTLVAKRRYRTLRLEYSKPGTGYVSSR